MQAPVPIPLTVPTLNFLDCLMLAVVLVFLIILALPDRWFHAIMDVALPFLKKKKLGR